MGEAKSFDISKLAVRDAYIRVKRNDGGAGVDAESLEVFEEDLEPVLEPVFDVDSYGYRPGKSALDALGHAQPDDAFKSKACEMGHAEIQTV